MPKAAEPKVKVEKKSKEGKPEREPRSRSFNGLNGSHIKALKVLMDGKSRTRAELSEATGINKGWSKLLGTKEGGHEDALESKGFVRSVVPPEGERGLRYSITASGKQALAKAEKEMTKAGKD